MRCCVQNCVNNDSKKTNKSQGLTFHKLPKDPNHSAAWLEAIARLGYRMNKSIVVCSKHFLPEDFDDTRHNQRRVKSGAVPTVAASFIQEEFKMCRVCLALDVKIYDMKNNKLSEMFQSVTGILAIDNKGPILQRVCWECAARLKAAAAFRSKALLSDTLLKDLVHIKKCDIATLKQNQSVLKSPLAVHELISSDIECEHTIFENKEIEVFLPNDNPNTKQTKIRFNDEEIETEIQEYEPWIYAPIKIEVESDPIADNSNPIPDRKSDSVSERTHFDNNFTSYTENSMDDISVTKVQINNNDDNSREDKQNKIPIINSKGNIVLADDKQRKLELCITVTNEEESSSGEDSQTIAEVSGSKPKVKMSSKVKTSSKKGTIRNYKINDRLKEKIIAMKKNGLPVSAISKETGLTISSIICWWRRYRKNGCKYRRSITAERDESDTKHHHDQVELGKEMGACSDIVRQRLHEAGLEHILMKKPEENLNMGKKTSERTAQHDDLKRRIITLKQKGLSTSRIAHLLNTSRNTVSKWWNLWYNEGHMQNHKKLGRKRKTTLEEDQIMIERVMQEQTVHTPSLAMEFGLSAKSLRNRLKEAGFKRKIREAYVPLKAGRCQKVDENLKQQIISMKLNGISVTDIANQFRVPRATIYQWWKRWYKENNVKVTSSNNTSTSTEHEQSFAEGAHVEKSLQTPAILSSQKSLWQKFPKKGTTDKELRCSANVAITNSNRDFKTM